MLCWFLNSIVSSHEYMTAQFYWFFNKFCSVETTQYLYTIHIPHAHTETLQRWDIVEICWEIFFLPALAAAAAGRRFCIGHARVPRSAPTCRIPNRAGHFQYFLTWKEKVTKDASFSIFYKLIMTGVGGGVIFVFYEVNLTLVYKLLL